MRRSEYEKEGLGRQDYDHRGGAEDTSVAGIADESLRRISLWPNFGGKFVGDKLAAHVWGSRG